MRKAVKNSSKPSNSSNATLNRAGGVAFEINDPVTKLITMTGGAFFAEPRYYDGTLQAKRATAGRDAKTKEKFEKFAKRIEINENGQFSKLDVDEVTKEILATASKIAEGPNPEDLLIIARWLRHDMNIRATPQALLVVASRFDGTKPYVRKYAPEIAVRPDEIKTCLLMHRFFFGMKSIKNCLAQGLSDATSKFKERGLIKYDSPSWPTWKDVLQVLPRGNGRPLSKELANYFLKGEVTDPAKTPVIAARKALNKLDKFDAEAKDLAVKSMVNWEVLLSQFGNEKKAVWEFLIENNLVGYMALMRNLRNLLEVDASDATIKLAVDKLSDPDQVRNSKQLPFRFLMAHTILENHFGRTGTKSRNVSKMLEALQDASNYSVENLQKLPGLTAVFADNSGSMMTPVSEKSQMTCAGAANTLCGIVAKLCEDSVVCAFGTDIGPVAFTKHDTVLSIAEKVRRADTKGMATNAYLAPEWLKRNNLKPDRVIILSDMQCWNSNSWGSRSQLCDTWASFKKWSPNTWMHSVHLNGYGDSPIDEDAMVNQVSGFSEKIFDMFLQVEGVSEDEEPIPTIEQIRSKFAL
jgi:hypothetical protein